MDHAHDAAPEYRPSPRPRIVHMPISELRISCPHDLLQLPKLGQETRDSVIHPFCMCRNCHPYTTGFISVKFKPNADAYAEDAWTQSRHTRASSFGQLACYTSLLAVHTPTQVA